MRPTEREIEAVREAIAGRPAVGRLTVGGVLRVDHMHRLQAMTGLGTGPLVRLWDRIIAHEETTAGGGDREIDVRAALEIYGLRLIDLAAQNAETSADRWASWERCRRMELLVGG